MAVDDQSFIVEIYRLKAGGIGNLRERFTLRAIDSKEAIFIVGSQLERREIAAIFSVARASARRGRPVGFTGNYSFGEWDNLRDALGGVQGVLEELRNRSNQELELEASKPRR